MLNVNNIYTRRTQSRFLGVFVVNFELISFIISIVDFEQVDICFIFVL